MSLTGFVGISFLAAALWVSGNALTDYFNTITKLRARRLDPACYVWDDSVRVYPHGTNSPSTLNGVVAVSGI